MHFAPGKVTSSPALPGTGELGVTLDKRLSSSACVLTCDRGTFPILCSEGTRRHSTSTY